MALNPNKNVLVTGGAGYVGAVLAPKLLTDGYRVTVFDLFIYGENVFVSVADHPDLTIIKGDLRDKQSVAQALSGIDAVIHLACISNDPSFELNPQLGKAINYDASVQLIDMAKATGVKRFIFASSSSVYGIKDVPDVTEEMPLEPLTDYSKYKALIEEYLLSKMSPGFVPLIIRPATVCGYSPRQRLDLTVNILTNHAFNKGKITVFGGKQKRPNIHIEDITDLYVESLQYPEEKIAGKIFNAGYENHSVAEIAGFVKGVLGEDGVEIVTEPTEDNRSYHISSRKIEKELRFRPVHTIEDAVKDLRGAFTGGKLPDSLTASRYFNIKRMQEIELK